MKSNAFRRVIDACPDAVIVTDRDARIEHVNEAFEKLTGYLGKELIGRTPAVLKSGLHEADFYRELWATIQSGGEFQATFFNRKRNGDIYQEEKIIRPLPDSGGRIRRFVSFGRDATRFARDLERLTHEATHDSLTDLPNRRVFQDRLAQALRQSIRRKEPLTVALLDLDRFKDTNTRFGHLGGDAVLQAVAVRTREGLRDADTVARIGGDEFGLILPGADYHAALKVLEKLVALNAQHVAYDGQTLGSSVSIGAICCPKDAAAPLEMLKGADLALYAAKRAGGNQCLIYGPEFGACR